MRYAEYAWNGTDWTVGVTGRGDTARVVMVATGLRRERTRSKVGVGSTERAVRRALAARCFGKEQRIDPVTGVRVYVPSIGKDTMSCYLGGRRRNTAHTTFSLVESCRIPTPAHVHCPGSKRVYRVYEVRVGEPRFVWGYPD